MPKFPVRVLLGSVWIIIGCMILPYSVGGWLFIIMALWFIIFADKFDF